MGGFVVWRKIKFVWSIDPPSPQSSPARRERGQVAADVERYKGDSGRCEMVAVI